MSLADGQAWEQENSHWIEMNRLEVIDNICERIEVYKKASDNLQKSLFNNRVDCELKERVESFSLSYDEHLVLNNLIQLLQKSK